MTKPIPRIEVKTVYIVVRHIENNMIHFEDDCKTRKEVKSLKEKTGLPVYLDGEEVK